VLRVSPAGYYAWAARKPSQHARGDARLAVVIAAAHERSRKTYGSPRIAAELRAQGERVSRKRIIRLMQRQQLRGRVRRRYRCTTDGNHGQPVAPNHLARDFTATAPNLRWVGDTSEFLVGASRSKLFVAVLLDLHSRFVVGWAISAVNDRALVLRALETAVKRRGRPRGLLHHTDQGSPYACEDYQRRLEELGTVCSMSRRGNCYDNAVSESFFSTLKLELGEHFESYGIAKEQLFDWIEVFYNQQRRHSSIGYRSPAEHERVTRSVA